MYVCICRAITDRQIREAARSGARNLPDLQRELGVATGCGACTNEASEILRRTRQQNTAVEPTTYRPALA